MVGGAKLNLVLMDQMTNAHIVVVVRLEQLQWTHGEATKDGLPQNHIRGMLARYKDVLTNRLLEKNRRQLVENNFAHRDVESLSYVVTNEVGG
jgi:hypothetical protein